ncbi:DNA-methyltransferase [Azorhizophilus paspali]|uniref:Methyltransferase n=2 Tax=Azorhizophilus paspali TaxID=69963 RepID=A0ABV6SH53_AZOPA
MFTIHRGDCLESMRTLPDNSVDSIVTDPPYGISFMGNRWDCDVPSTNVWTECLRVLKPGSHLLAFASPRTQHRMAARIEAAGFEIRDMIAWVYGSGFPKSRDVSQAMERYMAGEQLDPATTSIRPGVYRVTAFLREARNRAGWTNRQLDELFDTNGMAGHWTTTGSQPAVPSPQQWEILKAALGFGDELDALVADLGATNRPESGGQDEGRRTRGFLQSLIKYKDAPPAGGWGTALKPALEPITMARKPPVGSVTNNVMVHGTGALNIAGCRIGKDLIKVEGRRCGGEQIYSAIQRDDYTGGRHSGRWPANLLHDGGEDVTDVLGEAARFFYCPKASKKDREAGNTHPTVKPTDLMRYLCRLVTPPGGLVLDPFMGSGSTGKAAMLEGFRFIGCELSDDYAAIAQARIERSAQDAA